MREYRRVQRQEKWRNEKESISQRKRVDFFLPGFLAIETLVSNEYTMPCVYVGIKKMYMIKK